MPVIDVPNEHAADAIRQLEDRGCTDIAASPLGPMRQLIRYQEKKKPGPKVQRPPKIETRS